jgi:cell division protein FtsW
MKYFSRSNQSFLSQWWWTLDKVLLGLILILMVFGIALVATASPPVALRIGLNEYHFLFRHLLILVVSFAIMIGVSMLGVRQIWRFSFVMMVGSFFALVYVLFFGSEIKGAQRWIHLPGFSLQPSEFAKSSFIVVVAWLLSIKKQKKDFPAIKIISAIFAFLIGLIILQPDIGTTFIIISGFLTVIFLAGLPFRLITLLFCAGVGLFIIIYFSFSHFQSRINRFINPESGDTFQIEKSLDAFRQGGILGTGPGQGNVKLSIPDSHSDFIFSVAGEELGLFFILILVCVYAVIVIRGLNKIMDNNDIFVVLAGGGILAIFGVQTVIHMGSALSLLPTKGMTLPFISYGGSSLLSMSVAMGMVLALTRRSARSGIIAKKNKN